MNLGDIGKVIGEVGGGTAGFFTGGPLGAVAGWKAGGQLGSDAGDAISGGGVNTPAPGADPYVAQLLSQPFQYGVTSTSGQRQQAAAAQQQLGSLRQQVAARIGVPVDQVPADPATWSQIASARGVDLTDVITQGQQAAQVYQQNNVAPTQGETDLAQLQGYTDQLRGQAAPTLQRTDTSGIGGALATAAGQQGADRSQQQGLIQGLANDQSGRKQTALAGQVNADLAGTSAGAAGQKAYIDRLNSDLNGGQPSVAENQLRQGEGASIRNALSIAAGARGGAGNQAAATRAALNANAATGTNTNAQAATLRAQEYAQTRGELGQATTAQRSADQSGLSILNQLYGNQRTQDLNARGMALDATGALRAADTTGAGLQLGGQTTIAGINTTQNATQAQLDAQQRALALQGSLGYGQLGNAISSADTNTRQGYAELLNSRDLAERGLEFNQQQANTSENNKYLNMLMQGLGTGALLKSDERAKDDIRDADPKLADEMLSKLRAKTYAYKDPNDGAGPQFGIIAQALERSTLGKRLVVDTPAGKFVDVPRSVGALLAIAAGMHDRVSKLEGRA